MKIKFEFFRPDEIEIGKTYEEVIIDFTSWNAIMKFGEQHSQSLMEILNLEEIAWCYTVLLDKES